jgi:uncharacterized CHY-type Zn-finger protein
MEYRLSSGAEGYRIVGARPLLMAALGTVTPPRPSECESQPMLIHGHQVKGSHVDLETQCAHYHSDRDIVAIKFACCGDYYACFHCHEQCADHPTRLWNEARFDECAVLCGHCGYELTICEYLARRADCPACKAPFNPKCRSHLKRYFAVP